MELNYELVRWGVLILTFPLWGRFLGELWKDFSDTLIEEGGLFGHPPSLEQLRRLRAQMKDRPDLLVSEPWAHRGKPRAAGPRRSATAFQSRPRKGGFR